MLKIHIFLNVCLNYFVYVQKAGLHASEPFVIIARNAGFSDRFPHTSPLNVSPCRNKFHFVFVFFTYIAYNDIDNIIWIINKEV